MIIKFLPILAICTLYNTQLYAAYINYNIEQNQITQQKPIYTNNIDNVKQNNINDILEIEDNKFKIKIDDDINNYINNIGQVNNSINNKKLGLVRKHKYSRDSLSIDFRKQNKIKYTKDNHRSHSTKVIENVKNLSINCFTIEKIIKNENKILNPNNNNGNYNSTQYCGIKKYYISNNYIMNEYFKHDGNISINEIIRRAHKVVLLEGKVIIGNYKKLQNFNPKLNIDNKIQQIMNSPNNNINIYQYKDLSNQVNFGTACVSTSFATPNKKPNSQPYNDNHSDYNDIKLNINNHNNNDVINNGKNLLTEYNNQNIYNYNMVTPPNNHNKVQNPMAININISEEQNSSESNKIDNESDCKKNLFEQFNNCNDNYDKCDSTNYKTEDQDSKNKLENKQNSDEIKRNLYNTIIDDKLED